VTSINRCGILCVSAGLWFAACAFCTEVTVRKITRKEGWTAFGLPYVTAPARLGPKRAVNIEGGQVWCSDIKLDAASISRLRSNIMFVNLDDAQHAILIEKRLQPARMTVFGAGRRKFAVWVTANIVVESQGIEGTAGQIEVVFYDEDGDGVYETLEVPDVILGGGASLLPRIPQWVSAQK